MLRDQLKTMKLTARYHLLSTLVKIMTRLPATAVPKLRRLLMKVFPLVFARQLRRADELLPAEFAGRKDEILRRMVENQAQTILEVFFYEKLVEHNPDFIKVVGREHLEEATRKGKGIIILSAHFGNWEVMGYELRKMGLPLHVLARPQAVNQMTEFMNSFRERRGVKVIMEKSITESLKLLHQGKTVGMLSDLNAREWGYQVEFFGRNASFTVPRSFSRCAAARADSVVYRTAARRQSAVAFRGPDHLGKGRKHATARAEIRQALRRSLQAQARSLVLVS